MDKREKIRLQLRRDFEEGRCQVGDRLPTEAELVRRFGASRSTVREVLTSMAQEGLLERVRGRGTFITALPEKRASKCIAVVVPELRTKEGAFSTIIQGVEEELNRQGYSLTLCQHDDNLEKFFGYVDRLVQQEIAGVILIPLAVKDVREVNRRAVQRLREAGLPFVLADSTIPGENGWFSRTGTNGYDGLRRVVQHLRALGHERIAFIGGVLRTTAAERMRGFLDEMHTQGLLPSEAHCPCPQTEEEKRRVVRNLMSLSPRPTAITCLNDFLAWIVLEELQAMDLRVPDDVAVVGFDDLPSSRYSPPPLTTVHQPFQEEGQLAAKMLLEKITGRCKRERTEILPCRLVIRRSCGTRK